LPTGLLDTSTAIDQIGGVAACDQRSGSAEPGWGLFCQQTKEAQVPSYRAKVGADGAVAPPQALQKALEIREGVEVEFFVTLESDVFFHAITGTAKGWKGLFDVEVRNPPISIRERDEGVAEAIAEDHQLIRRQGMREYRFEGTGGERWGRIATRSSTRPSG
jgi:hypothetical protein